MMFIKKISAILLLKVSVFSLKLKKAVKAKKNDTMIQIS